MITLPAGPVPCYFFVYEMKERSTWVQLVHITCPVWIHTRLILMSFTKYSPLDPWKRPKPVWKCSGPLTRWPLLSDPRSFHRIIPSPNIHPTSACASCTKILLIIATNRHFASASVVDVVWPGPHRPRSRLQQVNEQNWHIPKHTAWVSQRWCGYRMYVSLWLRLLQPDLCSHCVVSSKLTHQPPK